MQQLSLFDEIPELNAVESGDATATIQDRFEAFHRANPAVYEMLKQMALQMKRNGRRKYGMKGMFEVLRWQYAIQTNGDEYKLNNIYTSRYARLLMDSEPELAGFFELRELKAI